MSEQALVPRHLRLTAMQFEIQNKTGLTWHDAYELATQLLELAEARMEPVQDAAKVV